MNVLPTTMTEASNEYRNISAWFVNIERMVHQEAPLMKQRGDQLYGVLSALGLTPNEIELLAKEPMIMADEPMK